jgi:hypothetical protein
MAYIPPNINGQTTMINSAPVVIASDQIIKVLDSDTVVLASNITTQNLSPSGPATAGSAVEISLNGDSTLTTQITGTYTGALSLQVTVNGTAWVTVGGIPFLNLNTSTYLATITSALQSIFQSNIAGSIKARITALNAVTGTATVNLQASSATAMVSLDSSLPSGTNNIGSVSIISVPSATYRAAATAITPAALATDILTVTGSATKTINITRIDLDGVQTTAGQAVILLIKRSTADTGGTSTAVNKVPLDSLSAASTATVLSYTANPAVGTAIGTLASTRMFLPGATTASDAQGMSMTYGELGGQQLSLRGTNQVLAVNLNGTTLTGGSINVNIEYTEV